MGLDAPDSAKRDSILSRIDALKVWSRRGERAPHKPLLLLFALGRFARGDAELSFAECAKELSDLLREFGPSRSSTHPEYPFWRLQNDGLWQVYIGSPLTHRQSNSDPTKGSLLAANAVGRFPIEIQLELHAKPGLVGEVASRLLAVSFPTSLHADILDAVGLDRGGIPGFRKVRDPSFRPRVLLAYEYRCALCGLDLRIRNQTIALEAAHIQWHQAGGPDTEANGIALCSLHHKLLDLGAFTVHPDYRVLVSESVHGGGQFESALLRHHGEPINFPSRPEHRPSALFLRWHRREVFRDRARFLAGLS